MTKKRLQKSSPKRERVSLASIDRKVDLIDARFSTLKAYENMVEAMKESSDIPAMFKGLKDALLHHQKYALAAKVRDIERELAQEELSQHKEPEPVEWVPKVGDLVVSDTHQTAILQRGLVYEVKEVTNDCRLWLDIGQHLDLSYAASNFRPATEAEATAYRQQQEKKQREEEELAKPLSMGRPVRCGDREGFYLWDDYNGFHKIALKGDEIFSAGISSRKRSEFTVLPETH